jgi:hypothetical protein
LREKLTFANVMSSVAVFLALGGTALAVKANSVGSRQIKDGSIKGRDVADGKLKGKGLKTATIGAREIDESAFDLEPFVKMDSTNFGCDPGSTSFVNCGSITLGTQEPSQVLLVAGGGQSGPINSEGTCKFRINNGTDLLASAPPSFGDPSARPLLANNGVALTAISDVIAPGVNNFKLVCNETGGDVTFSTTFSALAIGGTAD